LLGNLQYKIKSMIIFSIPTTNGSGTARVYKLCPKSLFANTILASLAMYLRMTGLDSGFGSAAHMFTKWSVPDVQMDADVERDILRFPQGRT
jgi:hypothetical protein